jgi:hypothetical protein
MSVLPGAVLACGITALLWQAILFLGVYVGPLMGLTTIPSFIEVVGYYTLTLFGKNLVWGWIFPITAYTIAPAHKLTTSYISTALFLVLVTLLWGLLWLMFKNEIQLFSLLEYGIQWVGLIAGFFIAFRIVRKWETSYKKRTS